MAAPDSTRAIEESAEGKRERVHAGIEKLDLELSVRDGFRLPDQLVHPFLSGGSLAAVVDVEAVICAGRLSVDAHAKSH
jgi:hypothetical protein